MRRRFLGHLEIEGSDPSRSIRLFFPHPNHFGVASTLRDYCLQSFTRRVRGHPCSAVLGDPIPARLHLLRGVESPSAARLPIGTVR